jgi:hypothetical protein
MNSSIVRSVMLAVILQTTASAQTRPAPVAASLCDVFASPAAYDQKLLSIDGVLFPSIHSVFLLSPSCPPKEDVDSTTQAVFPSSWVSLPNGKQLRGFLHRGMSAKVKLVGTLQSGPNRYGADGTRFQFVISEISSVEKAPPNIHP